MSISIEALKVKLDSLLQTISLHLADKLDRTDAAVSANQLTNPFTLSLTNDATAAASVSGSGAVNLNVVLKTVMASPGTHAKVTVDAKGRVVAGSVLDLTDIPALTIAKTTGLQAALDGKLGDNEAAVSAVKWTTPRSLTASGDVSGTAASIDGTSNISIALTLANSGAVAGVYPKVTVDAKGRVTGGAALAASDIPYLDASKVSTGTFAAARIPLLNQDTTGSAGTAAKLSASRTLIVTGDASGGLTTDWGTNPTLNLTLANTGVIAGTYGKVTVDAKGRVTVGTALTAGDIPFLDASKINSGTLLPARLAASGVVAGVYGGATQLPKVTVDNKGRVTAVELIDIQASTAMPVNEYISISDVVTKEYDLQTMMGAEFANYDIKTAEISVRVLDETVGSPTIGTYVNAESVAVYGVRNERHVVVSNQSGTPRDFYVKVLVHPVV